MDSMTRDDVTFFVSQGFRHVSDAEVRRANVYGRQTIELCTDGYWMAHYGSFYVGPKALSCQAAFVSAELEEWGGVPSYAVVDNEVRRRFKETFTG